MPVTRNINTHPHPGRSGTRYSAMYGGHKRAGTPTPTETVPTIIVPAQVFPQPDLSPTDLDSQALPSSPCSDELEIPYESDVPLSRSSKPNHIPRPRNAFIFFRSAFLSRATGGETKQQNLSKQAAALWHTLSKGQKAPYELLAKLEKKEHAEKYPNYTYCPNGKSKSKSKKPKVSTKSKATSTPEKTRSSLSQIARSASPRSSSLVVDACAAPISRTSRVARAAARRAVELINRTPPPSPVSSPAQSSSDGDDDFFPLSGIPDLELNSGGQDDYIGHGLDAHHPDDPSDQDLLEDRNVPEPEYDLVSKTLTSVGRSVPNDAASMDLASDEGLYYNALGEIIAPDVSHVPKEDWTTDGEMLAAMSYLNLDGCASVSVPPSL